MSRTVQTQLRLADLAKAIDTIVTRDRIESLARVLCDNLTDDEIEFACSAIERTETRLPAPVKFIELAKGSSRDQAEEVLGLVMKAIKLYGHPQPGQARAFIGEDGWRVVERCGGWQHICGDPDFKIEVFRSQFIHSFSSNISTTERRAVLGEPQRVQISSTLAVDQPTPEQIAARERAREFVAQFMNKTPQPLDEGPK